MFYKTSNYLSKMQQIKYYIGRNSILEEIKARNKDLKRVRFVEMAGLP